MKKRKFLFLLALLLIAASSAWADSESIWTNTSQSSYSSGNITIVVDAAGDKDGAYVNSNKMVISTSDGGNITQVVLRIGYYVTDAPYVTANHGSCEVSGTGSDKETYVTITSINAPSVTVTSSETVQVDHVDVTYSPFIAVTGVSLSPTSAVLTVGGTTTLTATVAPANATNKSVTWTTSNASVATVANGVVTAVGVGSATITATTTDGAKTASCAVTVDDPVTVAKYVGKVIAADGKVYKTLAAANKYSTASGIVAYYGSEVVETGQTYKAIAISLTNSERTNMYCGLDNTSCSGSTYGDIATALTVKNGIATTATTLETNVAHGYSHQLYYAAKETTPAPPAGASAWSIPSIGQWNLILKGLTGSGNNLSTSANASFSASNVNAKIPTGADGFSELNYWSCTEKDNNKMWMMQFNGSGGLANNINKKNYATQGLRTMFAFTSATPVYIVNYDANGGSGAPDEQVRDGGTSLTLSSTVPTREGYAFAGWNTAADGSGASYAAGEAYTTDDDVTLYAQWTATPTYNLTANEGATGEFWATFYSDASNYQASSGTKVFAVNLTDAEITMTEISDGIVKSGEGVVLKNTSASITMTPTASAGTGDWTDNSLTGTMTSITNPGNAYVLNKKDGTGVGFYRLSSGGTIGANKAYLTYSGTLAREFFLFDEATGISATLMNIEEVNGEVYDLQGRRVSQPTKGLYIVNGKKYIKK